MHSNFVIGNILTKQDQYFNSLVRITKPMSIQYLTRNHAVDIFSVISLFSLYGSLISNKLFVFYYGKETLTFYILIPKVSVGEIFIYRKLFRLDYYFVTNYVQNYVKLIKNICSSRLPFLFGQKIYETKFKPLHLLQERLI